MAETRGEMEESTKPLKGVKGQWLSKLKGWILTSEPSAQALKQQKKVVYEKAGISPRDPDASAKLDVYATTIPDDAIRPASGPDPDSLARKRAKERSLKRIPRNALLHSSSSPRTKSPSVSSSVPSSSQSQRPSYPL